MSYQGGDRGGFFECMESAQEVDWRSQIACDDNAIMISIAMRTVAFSTAVNDPISTELIRRPSGTATTYISGPELEGIERLYIFQNHPEVTKFLENHSFLFPLLVEIYGRIQRYFPLAPLMLEVFTDPEVGGDPVLFINIGTYLDAREALSTLRSFNRDWWLDNLGLARGKLFIDVELL